MKINCIVCEKETPNLDEAYPEDNPEFHPADGTAPSGATRGGV